VPGAFDGLETAVAIILGQLVSTAQGRLNLRKLVERFGARSGVGFHPRLSHFFPSPETLAREDLSVLGFTKVRSQAINELARATLEGRLVLSRSTDPGATRRSLAQIRGIGPWTIEMIALRCLGETDAFPASDLVLKRALAGCALPPDAFRPWRSYLALSLWNLQTAQVAASLTQQAEPARSADLPRRTP
jgi:AraC family transcriptional regulator, regulatory protein of adaptative response / DNA-3-methyladenine glycosylase II